MFSETLSSDDLAARIAANPNNLPGIEGARPLPLHLYWAARFEGEGRRDYPRYRNPYNSGTMAHSRYRRGFNAAAAADPDTWEARRAAWLAA